MLGMILWTWVFPFLDVVSYMLDLGLILFYIPFAQVLFAM